MNELLLIVIGSVLVNNFVMSQFLGICPFLGVSKKTETALGMGMAVTFVMALASLITYFIQAYLLVPLDLEYMQTIAFILVIAVLVQIVEIALKKISLSLYQALGVYLPLITTNCAVLGVTMLVIDKFYNPASPMGFSYAQALVNAFGSGVGFMVAMVIFAGVRERLEMCDVPKFLKGLPITLIAASLVAVSFLGFSGLVDGMLG